MLSKNVEYWKSELSALRLFYWKAKILNPNKKKKAVVLLSVCIS